MRGINPSDVEKTRITISDETYEKRFQKIDSIKTKEYTNILAEVKDIRDAEIYCTKIIKHTGDYSDSLAYGAKDYWPSFKQIYSSNLHDCDDGAIAAASILYDNGFHPYLLSLGKGELEHMVFLYRDEEGKFGTIGINKEDCQRPKYTNIKELIKDFRKNYKRNFDMWAILDAKEVFPDAIHKEQNYKKFSSF
jgi:hypothetical protein